MLTNKRDLFSLPEEVTYLNGAYMSPQLKSVEHIGIKNLRQKNLPYEIKPADFFTGRDHLKKAFATLIQAPDYRSIAIIPSVSYGMATAAQNVPLNKGDEILIVDEQFPSNVYVWKKLAQQKEATLKIVASKTKPNNGKVWNDAILKAITPKTAVVAMPHVHWADGTLFDLGAIREKTREVNALLLIDGTQSVGALPFSVTEIQPDALICGGYKWLLGPYSLGVAYYGAAFNHGDPIEDNWINRAHSEDFSKLVQYQDAYQAKAARFSVGESSNFILVPMLTEAISQLIAWNPAHIQAYCENITKKVIPLLRDKGCHIETEAYRAHHLFGIYTGPHQSLEKIKAQMERKQLFVSYRGDAIRISCNVYNTEQDFDTLLSCF